MRDMEKADKYVEIYGDCIIIKFDTPIRSEEKFALYNLKTKELNRGMSIEV